MSLATDLSLTIHPTAIIEDGAIIGNQTEIGPYSIIRSGVRLGENNKVGPHVVIEGNTTIGDNNQIFQFASIGSAPQDLKWDGEFTALVIGNHNIMREYVTIQPGVGDGNMTKVGDHNLFMGSSHIAHDCIIGNGCRFVNSAAIAGHVVVGNHAIVGGLSGVHQFSQIGDHAFIAAGSIVTMDIPPYVMAEGNRAGLVQVNKIGLQRNGFAQDDIDIIDKIFKKLFYGEGLFNDKLTQLEKEYSHNALLIHFFDFIKNSKRGIAKRRSG